MSELYNCFWQQLLCISVVIPVIIYRQHAHSKTVVCKKYIMCNFTHQCKTWPTQFKRTCFCPGPGSKEQPHVTSLVVYLIMGEDYCCYTLYVVFYTFYTSLHSQRCVNNFTHFLTKQTHMLILEHIFQGFMFSKHCIQCSFFSTDPVLVVRKR